MLTSERIQQYLEQLPAPLQAEVLNFVEYLVNKAERSEAAAWSAFSLTQAMSGMEQDEEPTYSLDDVKVPFA